MAAAEGSKASGSAQRVMDALAAAGVDAEIRSYPEGSRTAQEAADAIGCAVAQICKSLVFRCGDEPFLVLTSGSNHVDEKKLAALVGQKPKRADASFVREKTGFAIGGVSPVGHIGPVTVLVDEDLMAFDEVWAAAGTPNSVFRTTGAALLLLTGGRAATIAQD